MTAEAPDSSDQQRTESQKSAPSKRKAAHVDDTSPAADDPVSKRQKIQLHGSPSAGEEKAADEPSSGSASESSSSSQQSRKTAFLSKGKGPKKGKTSSSSKSGSKTLQQSMRRFLLQPKVPKQQIGKGSTSSKLGIDLTDDAENKGQKPADPPKKKRKFLESWRTKDLKPGEKPRTWLQESEDGERMLCTLCKKYKGSISLQHQSRAWVEEGCPRMQWRTFMWSFFALCCVCYPNLRCRSVCFSCMIRRRPFLTRIYIT